MSYFVKRSLILDGVLGEMFSFWPQCNHSVIVTIVRSVVVTRGADRSVVM